MPAFQYEAIDSFGQFQRGTVQADTARGARAQLRARDLTVLSADQVSNGAGGSGEPRLDATSKFLMTRQLATLVRAGLPLDEALAALGDNTDAKASTMALALRARVMEGSTLATALDGFPATFDALYRASVAAGEHSGQLSEVLLRLADHLERRDALRRRLTGALAYPVLLLLVALLVVSGLMFYVVPEVTAVFIRAGQALPLPTRVLLASSQALRAHGPLLGILLLVVVALPASLWQRPAFLQWRHQRLLGTPLVGRWVLALEFSRFARTLALLGMSAVPLLDALHLATRTVRNTQLRESLADVAIQVRAGSPLSKSLAANPRFPAIAVRMINSGESAGRLDSMLDEAAAQLERELETAASVAMTALGPTVILLVGGLVLFIVLAILLPIFEMNQLVK